MTNQELSNVLTINRLLSHFTTDNLNAIRSCISDQLNCENEAQFLSKVLNICYTHCLLSTKSIKTIKNAATKIGHKQKIITPKSSQKRYTVCQYVDHEYKDPLSRLNSNIIDYLGEYLTDKDSNNFGLTNKQLYIETKKSCYIKIRLRRKKDNAKRFYFRYIYFNDLIRLEPDDQSSEMWGIGGIDKSKYMNELHWYKNTKFSQVFDYWEKQHNIKKENQLVYLVTERQNHTMRPNREIFKQQRKSKRKWPLNENNNIYFKQHGHNVFLNRTRQWTLKSTRCMLFDKRAVHKIKNAEAGKDEQKEKEKGKELETIDDQESDNDHEDQDTKIENDTKWINDNQALLILKYFDIFKQKVIFIDAIICEKDCMLNDILNHFLNNIIVKSKNDSILKLCQLMENSETKLSFTMYEEVNAMNAKFHDLTSKLNESIKDAKLGNGDILIIGLNADKKNQTILKQLQPIENFEVNVEYFCFKNGPKHIDVPL